MLSWTPVGTRAVPTVLSETRSIPCKLPVQPEHWPLYASKWNGSVVSESPAWAGWEIFHFGRFEHRMTSRVPRPSRRCGSLRSPASSRDRESGVTLPRNISSRTGVCRVEAVSKTFVSPRGWSAAGLRNTTAKQLIEGESDEDVAQSGDWRWGRCGTRRHCSLQRKPGKQGCGYRPDGEGGDAG